MPPLNGHLPAEYTVYLSSVRNPLHLAVHHPYMLPEKQDKEFPRFCYF